MAMDAEATRALFKEAVALHQEGDLARAENAYRMTIAAAPTFTRAHHNLGLILRDTDRRAEAERCFRAALAVEPTYAICLNSLGGLLKEQQRFDEALDCFDRALATQPDYVDALVNCANTLGDIDRTTEAVTYLERAVALAPNDVDVLWNLGRFHADAGETEKAIAALAEAVVAAPDNIALRGALYIQKRIACVWDTIDDDARVLLHSIRTKRAGVEPPTAWLLPTTPADQLLCAQRKATEAAQLAQRMPAAARRAGDRIRLAYFSGDFRIQPVAQLRVDVIERHDRDKFDVIAISYGYDDRSDMRRRLEGAFDRFIDVAGQTDRAVAARIAAEDVDILIDLGGHNAFARPGVLAARPAPIHANFLGYTGTLGGDLADYVIADAFVTPEAHAAFYAEKLALLPGCYQPNGPRRVSAVTPARRDCGLPDTAVVLCAFGASHKMDPGVFDRWMSILRDHANAVLWLSGMQAFVAANIRAAAHGRGVDPTRLIFADRLPDSADHLARHRVADLFVDTLPYNAHSTMGDALYAGLPAVTCAGETFVARVGGSMLRAVGLADMVTDTLDAYERLIRDLIDDPSRLTAVRARLADALPRAPLFDTTRHTRHLEAAYARMWQLHCAGEQPQRIVVT